MFCLAIAIAMTGLAAPAFAAGYSDTDGHWGAAAIEKWSGYGVLHGNGDGAFAPDRAMTPDELATVLVNTFGYAERYAGELPGYAESWRGAEDAVRKAVAAGAMTPAEAAAPLTRELAVKIIAEAYHVAPEAGASGFADDAGISAAYRGYVAAFREKGYAIGTGAGNFSPKKAYTRAEAMQVIENMVGDIYGAAGERTGDVEGDLIVNAGGVTVKDAVVSGDLIIADGVGEGDAALSDVEVKGRLIVRGGGDRSIHLLGARTVIPSVLVYKSASGTPVRIVFEAGARAGNVVVEKPAIIEVLEGAKIDVLTINNAAVSVVAVKGSVGAVEIAKDVASEMPAGAVNTDAAPAAPAAPAAGGGGGGGTPSSPSNPTNPATPATPTVPPVDLAEYTEVTTFEALLAELLKGTEKIVLGAGDAGTVNSSILAAADVIVPAGTELLITDAVVLSIPSPYTLTVSGTLTLGLDSAVYGYEGRGSVFYRNTGAELDMTNIRKVSGQIDVSILSLTDPAAKKYLTNDMVFNVELTTTGALRESVTVPSGRNFRISSNYTLTVGAGAVLTVEGNLRLSSSNQIVLEGDGALVQAPGGYIIYEVSAGDSSAFADALAKGYSVSVTTPWNGGAPVDPEVATPIEINGDLTIPAGSHASLGASPKLIINGNLTINGSLHLEGAPLIVSGTLSIGPHPDGVGYEKDGGLQFWTNGGATPAMTVGGTELFGTGSVRMASDGRTADCYINSENGIRTIGFHDGTSAVAEDLALAAADKIMVGRHAALEIAAGKTLSFAGAGAAADRLYGENGALLTVQSGAHIRIGTADAGFEDNSVYEWQNGAWRKLIAAGQ
jgi:hypothetical protein